MKLPRLCAFALLLLLVPAAAAAQSITPQPVSDAALGSEAPGAVPALLRLRAQLPAGAAATVLRFALYASATSQSPLWSERHTVTPAADGSYEVLLGSESAAGLPSSLFPAAQPRWLAVSLVHPDGSGEELSRTLLTQVPYAARATDADALGGQPAAEYVLRSELQGQPPGLASSSVSSTKNAATPAAAPTGAGTLGYLPLWSSATALGNSALFQKGTATAPLIGLGTKTPATTLDVNGKFTLRDAQFQVPGVNAVKTSQGIVASPLFAQTALDTVRANSFSLGWQTTAVNTNPSGWNFKGNLQLMTSRNGAAWTPTGFSIREDGLVKFVAGQGFPGAVMWMNLGAGLTGNISGSWLNLAIDPTAQLAYEGSPAAGKPEFSAINDSSGAGLYAAAAAGGSGVLGLANGKTFSGTYLLSSAFGTYAGVWGDAGVSKSTTVNIGVLGTADDGIAGAFHNSSATRATLFLSNTGGGSTQSAPGAPLLLAQGSGGACRISSSGDLACTGGLKTLVSTQAGTHTVETYAVHSAENWMEDFGEGTLAAGQATIPLDATFAEAANTAVAYHVFLTPRGECNGLYIAERAATGFVVRELGHGRSSVAFDYRIVARPRGQEAQRFTDVTEQLKAEGNAMEKQRIASQAGPSSH